MPRARRSSAGLGRRGAVLLALALVALGAFVALSRRQEEAPRSGPEPLSASIPPGAVLVVEIDLAALRSHPLGAELLGQGREIAGLGKVTEVCQVDPLSQIDRIALAVPELEGVGFGLFAHGTFEAETLLACASEIVRRRGGRPTEPAGAPYRVMRDASLEAASAELAVRDGALILAEPPYLAQALASHGGDARHAELRALVPPGLVVATAVLSAAQRQTLLDELRAQGESSSPLASLRDAAVSLRLGQKLEAEAVVRCSEAEACRRVAEQLARRRDDLAKQPTYRVLGLGELLARVAIRAEGERVLVSVALEVAELTGVLDRLRLLEQLMQPSEETPEEIPRREAPPLPPDAGERVAPAEAP
jgi:hypothetical protein